MSNCAAKKDLFAHFATIAKALANGHRLELIEYLAQGERTVEGLAGLSSLSMANTSQHLQILRRAGLVVARRSGHFIYYGVADQAVIGLVVALRSVAETNRGTVEQLVSGFWGEKDRFEPVAADELLERARQGLVTVLDVRPPEEYAAGHLPHALNIPLGQLKQRLAELPRDQEIVAYCRGPYCVLAYEAVVALRQEGFAARRLDGGLPEWRLAGHPVARDGVSI